MNLQNRNNLILSLIAETQFDAYVQGYMAKAGAAAGASDNLLVEAEGAAMLQGLVAPVRAQQRACGQPLQNALLQIAHDLLLQTKSQLAIAANASSIHVIQRDMNRAIWNIATAIDHLAEFAQPSQDTVKVIERLMLFVGSSPSPEGQQLAAEASAVLGMSEGAGMKPMIQAHLVERDQFGFWTHPNYPDLADNCSSSEAQETCAGLDWSCRTSSWSRMRLASTTLPVRTNDTASGSQRGPKAPVGSCYRSTIPITARCASTCDRSEST